MDDPLVPSGQQITTPSAEIAARLTDGPLAGRTVEAGVVEGRPPKTIDVPDSSGACRYCLEEWVQTGGSAEYSFLYRV